MKKYSKILIGLLLLLWSLSLEAQYAVSNDCGSSKRLEMVIDGVANQNSPSINIGSMTNVSEIVVTVWIPKNTCNGNGFPNTITVTNGSQSQTPNAIIPGSSSSGNERLYRTSFNNPTNSTVNVSVPGTCDPVSISVVKVISGQSGGTSYAYEIDEEFHHSNQTFTVNIGTATQTRDVTLYIPVHEKSNDGRVARVEAWGNGVPMVSQQITMQTDGPDAGLITLTVPNVPSNLTTLQVKIISPNNNGDSFGVDIIATSTSDCTCSNYTNAGTINATNAGSYCDSYDPPNITNTASPSGGFGGIPTYRWQMREHTTNCSGTYGSWITISGATGLTYNPPNITRTTRFRRQAKRDGCGGWISSNQIEYIIVKPLTDAGTISGDETNCGSFDPANITSSATPSGGCGGTIEYQWQSRNGTSGSWTNISGATNATYNPTTITQTVQYRRRTRRNPCTSSWSN